MKIRELNKQIKQIIIAVGFEKGFNSYIQKYNDLRFGFRRHCWKGMRQDEALEVLKRVNEIDPGWALYEDLTLQREYVRRWGIKKYLEL